MTGTDLEPREAKPSEEETQRIERLVWKSLGVKSIRRIAQETGLAPEEILRIKTELLDSVDVLTIADKRTKLLVSLQEMADDAQDRSRSIADEFYAGSINASVGAIKAVLVELNRMSKTDEDKITTLNNLRVKELLSLIDEVVDISVTSIAEKHSLDRDELMAVFSGHLIEAAQRRDMANN